MNDKPFKILSIDGGGIKGLYTASILARIEEKTGKSISEYFDMICGTSTGGLIALGLASGKTAQELANLYCDRGSEIFSTYNNRFLRRIQGTFQFSKQIAFWGKHSNKGLKRVLTDTFGTLTLKDANNLLCIPSFNLSKGEPRVFKFPHEEGGFIKDGNISMVDVALATSAAPTYLPIHEHNNILYADGGVWANNPSLTGLVEALNYFVGDNKAYNTYQLLSIPSITEPTGWASTSNKSRSFVGWRDKIFQTSMDGQAYFTDFFLRKINANIYPQGIYHRLQSPSLSKEHLNIISMDRADKKALKTLRGLGDNDGYAHASTTEVLNFFNTPKTYKTK